MILTDEQFRALYERVDTLVSRSGCSHTLRRTRSWLQRNGAEIRPNIEKIMDLGGLCDCEVLMNVTPSEWKVRLEEELVSPEIIGEAEYSEIVSRVMLRAVQHSFTWS